jgi:hypothetical protein
MRNRFLKLVRLSLVCLISVLLVWATLTPVQAFAQPQEQVAALGTATEVTLYFGTGWCEAGCLSLAEWGRVD